MTISELETLFKEGRKPTYREAISYIEMINGKRRLLFCRQAGRKFSFDALMDWNMGIYRDVWFCNAAFIHRSAAIRYELVNGRPS